MIKAVPIDAKGNPVGPAQNFSDVQFQKMKRTFKKNFAWKEVEHVSDGKHVELIPGAVSTKGAISNTNLYIGKIVEQETPIEFKEIEPIDILETPLYKRLEDGSLPGTALGRQALSENTYAENIMNEARKFISTKSQEQQLKNSEIVKKDIAEFEEEEKKIVKLSDDILSGKEKDASVIYAPFNENNGLGEPFINTKSKLKTKSKSKKSK